MNRVFALWISPNQKHTLVDLSVLRAILFSKEIGVRHLRDDTVLILDGEVRVYRRERSRRWQAEFSIDGVLAP